MIDTVIFDMDGLMFDTECLSTEIWANVLKSVNLEVIDEFILKIKGTNVSLSSSLFKEYYPDSKYEFSDLSLIRDKLMIEYLNHNEIPVKEGLYDLLTYLKINNYKLGVASSSPKEIIYLCLEKSNVIKYFDEIVFGSEVKRSKPNPDIFLLCASRLNSKIENCLILEDSYNGVKAGVESKAFVINIPDEINFDVTPSVTKLNNLKEVIKYLEDKYEKI